MSQRLTAISMAIIMTALIVLSGGFAVSSQEANPAPTLIPPTPVPQNDDAQEVLPSQSAIARIVESGRVRVGILYNEPPFGELNIRGEHTGYDADLARSIADVWGVEVTFVQVTRNAETSAQMLRAGEVDMLIAARTHTRDLDAFMEFSQTYYMGQQALMVRTDDTATEPAHLADRTIGVVIATPAQDAVAKWVQRTGITATVQTFLTLDQAYSALVNNQIDGIVDSSHRLRQFSIQFPQRTRTLETPLELAPFAIAVLRQDVNMRNLVNRTLQHMERNGRLDEIHRTYFPGESYDVVKLWHNLGEDAPKPDQYPTELVYPATYTLPQMRQNGVLRVAGLTDDTPDSPESEHRLNTFHRELLQRMAALWGVRVEFIPNSAGDALERVANGEADLAVGITPDWSWVDRVDFTGTYLLHGARLMVRSNSTTEGFADLRGGKLVATPTNEETAASLAVKVAESINARIEITQVREADLAFALLGDGDVIADAVFADSLKLIAHIQQHPQDLRMIWREDGTHWYSQSVMAMAVPRNDIDFRMLIEYTLQELVRDGTLNTLLQPLMLSEDIPTFEIWPGSGTYLGLSVGN